MIIAMVIHMTTHIDSKTIHYQASASALQVLDAGIEVDPIFGGPGLLGSLYYVGL